jgi:hypothetical protein
MRSPFFQVRDVGSTLRTSPVEYTEINPFPGLLRKAPEPVMKNVPPCLELRVMQLLAMSALVSMTFGNAPVKLF